MTEGERHPSKRGAGWRGRRRKFPGFCMLAEKRMFSSGVQRPVVKIPKNGWRQGVLPIEIVEHNKFRPEKLTKG